MRWIPLLLISCCAFLPTVRADDANKNYLDLSGTINGRGLPVAESDKPVFRFQLTATLDKKGEGTGTLLLDPTPRPVDEFGFPEIAKPIDPVKLECTLKFQKSKKIGLGRLGARETEVEWQIFEIAGPKIASRITLSCEAGQQLSHAYLLIADKDGAGRVSVTVSEPPKPEPCHPGCFPAGTPIGVPGGSKSVETIRAGDPVTTIDAEGKIGKGKVESVFVTENRLVEVRTEGKTLLTTETQPLALAAGGLKPAGELKAGDRIFAWDGRGRTAVAVKSVEATGRRARVFNLILGEPVLFVADGYLARSKPPADVAKP